jgi:hypothetical protein
VWRFNRMKHAYVNGEAGALWSSERADQAE